MSGVVVRSADPAGDGVPPTGLSWGRGAGSPWAPPACGWAVAPAPGEGGAACPVGWADVGSAAAPSAGAACSVAADSVFRSLTPALKALTASPTSSVVGSGPSVSRVQAQTQAAQL